MQKPCSIHRATILKAPCWGCPPCLCCRSHLPSHSQERKRLFCLGVSDKYPPYTLCTAPQEHHIPKPAAVPSWKRITVGPISQATDSDLGRCQGRRGSLRKKQNKTGLEARLVEPQPSSSQSGEGGKKSNFILREVVHALHFWHRQQARGHLGHGSRIRAEQSREKGSSQGGCSPADALPSAAVGFT